MSWNCLCTTDDGVYLGCYMYMEKIHTLCFLSDDGELQRLSPPLPDNVSKIYESNGILWMLTDSDYDAEQGYCLCAFDGEKLSEYPVDIGENCFPEGICAVGDLVFVSIMSHNTETMQLAAYDLNGQEVYKLEIDGSFDMASDGESLYMGVRHLEENLTELVRLDHNRRETEHIATFDWCIFQGCRGDRFYFRDHWNTALFEYDISTGQSVRLFQFADIGIPVPPAAFTVPFGEGSFIVSGLDYLYLVSPQLREARTQLTLAINAPAGRYARAILDFNENSEEYEVTIKNYSEYPNPQEILGAELAAGNGPDIIDAASFSGDIIHAGVMVDLMQYLNTDSEISTDDLLQGPLNTMLSSGGEMYAIAPYFYVATLFCRAEIAEVQPFAGVPDALKRLGTPDAAFAGTMSRGTFLTLAFCCGDFESFSREDIAAILEYTASLPETEDYSEEFENIISGRQRFKSITLGSATHIQGMALNSFGEADVANIAIWGMPFRDGTGVLIPEMYLAIPEGCANKDAAWEFIKAMLRTDGNLDNEFPLLIANYEKFRQYAQSLIDDCVKMSYITKEGTGAEYVFENLDYFDMSDQLLDGLSTLCDVDATIYPIICQCAEPYFEGGITAEAAAENIISRVNLYISEQYG